MTKKEDCACDVCRAERLMDRQGKCLIDGDTQLVIAIANQILFKRLMEENPETTMKAMRCVHGPDTVIALDTNTFSSEVH